MGAVSVKMHESWLATMATAGAGVADEKTEAAVAEAAMTEHDRFMALVAVVAAGGAA